MCSTSEDVQYNSTIPGQGNSHFMGNRRRSTFGGGYLNGTEIFGVDILSGLRFLGSIFCCHLDFAGRFLRPRFLRFNFYEVIYL